MQWEAILLQDALRHVYQRVLVESLCEVRELAEKVWEKLINHAGLVELLLACCPFISIWLCLSMQPVRVPYDPTLLIIAKTQRRKNVPIDGLNNFDQNVATPKLFIGGSETTPVATRECNAVKVRCMTARMLGLLSFYIVQPAPGVDYSQGLEVPIDSYVNILLMHLQSKSALQRMISGLVIAEWASHDQNR